MDYRPLMQNNTEMCMYGIQHTILESKKNLLIVISENK